MNNKYLVSYTSKSKKQIRKLKRQGKNIDKLINITKILARGEQLDEK